MKIHPLLCLIFLFLLCFVNIKAQVSHGGKPLSLITFRCDEEEMFEEMPFFDLDEELKQNSIEQSDFLRGYKFAYKFMTSFHQGNSGVHFTLPDGTKVWRLGIRSKDALSINVLFSEYELPEGAQLFLYDTSQSYILGAFNHLNNSSLDILPVAPIPGDELIIEYQEPANASFRGRLTIGEINHGYYDFRGREPAGNNSSYFCMDPVICWDNEEYDLLSRSVVVIIVDGVTLCSGVMVNNTANDGKPYLLTASHCLNQQFLLTNPDYEAIAGRIVSFFNYNSPFCGSVVRGTEELSMASARYVSGNESADMALLELLESPPVYYQPYYAGWNAKDAGNSPYIGMHHPGGAVKRINLFNGSLSSTTLQTMNGQSFYSNSHWYINRWTQGSTAGGSSGSPLFDMNGHVIGLLSAGSSTCYSPVNDYYYSLGGAWSPVTNTTQQLATWLGGGGSPTVCEGLDPYKDAPAYRFSNVRALKKQDLTEVTKVSGTTAENLFGYNSAGINTYLEKYENLVKGVLYGTYIVTPATSDSNLNVEIIVYDGGDKPENVLYKTEFSPTYANWDSAGDTMQVTEKPLTRVQEHFVTFTEPVKVSGNFFVGYRILSSDSHSFAAYNLPAGEVTGNTTWLYYNNNWIEATSHPLGGLRTSLYMDPVLQYGDGPNVSNETPDKPKNIRIYQSQDRNYLYIILPDDIEQAEMKIYSLDGKLHKAEKIYQSYTVTPLLLNNAGVYVVEIKINNNYYTQKILF